MKVDVCYPITKHEIIELPDNLAIPFKEASAEKDPHKKRSAYDAITEYIIDYVEESEDSADWIDWEEWVNWEEVE